MSSQQHLECQYTNSPNISRLSAIDSLHVLRRQILKRTHNLRQFLLLIASTSLLFICGTSLLCNTSLLLVLSIDLLLIRSTGLLLIRSASLLLIRSTGLIQGVDVREPEVTKFDGALSYSRVTFAIIMF